MDEKYIKFFEGYRQAYGVADMSTLKIDPESRKQKPIYRWNDEQLTNKIYKNHLEGTQSIGVQPCNENGQARFGVIDIDPNDYGDFDRKFFIDTLQTYNLPLIPVLSKSGGLHLYMFIDKFIDASLIKSFLSNLLPIFKLKPDTEIFPKQTQLTKDNETGQLNKGNFINLPYFKKTERVAINEDGTQFTFDQFIEVIENNTVSQEDLKIITDSIEKQDMEGVDEEFIEGPPCLAHLSKIMKDPKVDGKDRFMYNYHVFVKMKYPDDWQKKVKNAPVKYFIGEHANAWDDKMVAAKVRSWTKQFKGFTCTQSPISEHCKRGICVKKKFGILAGSKGNYPVLTNLKKIDLDPEPEYEFDVQNQTV